MDRASKQQIENEFGRYDQMWGFTNISTKNEDALETILKEGEVEETKAGQKFGSTNDSKYGSMYLAIH
jgi:hypothetical protein